MNPAELEALLLGLLRQWQVEGRVQVRQEGAALAAAITPVAGPMVTVERSVQPFGVVWQLQAEGDRRLTYPSLIGCIRYLRERLPTGRGPSRVVFAKGAGG